MAEEKDNLAPESEPHYIEQRNAQLREIPYDVVKRAWFILSHMLLDEGARVAEMGCGDGQITYAMAALNPRAKFIGVDKSKRGINKARQTYKLPNLEYKLGDAASDLFKPETLDGVINNFVLHEIFSGARYNEQIISDTLRKHYKMLKNNGLLFIRDYARPPMGEFVMMEFHDKKSFGPHVKDLSEADLLVWYSEHARPKQDPGCGGFFLEELPPRLPKTRLFRLPYKWAYEFMMRKDRREDWSQNLPVEFTFFTPTEFRRELRGLGARVEFSGPHWDDEYIKNHFDGHFRLLNQAGEMMGDPSTSFIALARKMPERTSLNIQERRIASEDDTTLKIRTVRDQKNGTLLDVVTRNKELAEIFPYRVMPDGRLNIFLHDGIVRGLVNAVPRSGLNIDGKEWSGHMVEPIAVDYTNILEIDRKKKEDIQQFARTYLGLKPAEESEIEEGPFYYPDPSYIDERIHTYYLKVMPAKTPMQPKSRILQNHHFHAKGSIREFNAQQILDAIAVGYIPNARLELQILSLMQHVNVRAENWVRSNIAVQRGLVTKRLDIREYLRQVMHSEQRFKEVRNHAGQFRTLNSIFVEEGQSQGGRTGLSSQNLDFCLSDDTTVNTAIILPLTASARGDLHAGFLMKHLPIPQRYEGKALTICAPQINIPKEITNQKMLRQYLAEKLNATPDMIIKLGEPYFTHIGMTPHKIYPYALAAPPNFFKDPDTKFLPFYQYMLLWKKLSKQVHLMSVIARAYQRLPDHMRMAAKKEVLLMLDGIFQRAKPDWTMPASVAPTDEDGAQNKSTKPGMQPGPGKDKNEDNERSENITDSYKRREKEKKERRDRKKRGIEQKIVDPDEEDDVLDSGDPEAMENINQKREAASKMEMKLVEEFRSEIKSIQDLINSAPGPKLDKD